MNMVCWNLAWFLMAGGQPVVQVLQGRSCHYNNPGNSCNCDCPPGNRLVTTVEDQSQGKTKQTQERKAKQMTSFFKTCRPLQEGTSSWDRLASDSVAREKAITGHCHLHCNFVSTSGFIVSSISTAQCLNWGQNAAYYGVMSCSALSCDHAVTYCTTMWN